MSRILKHGLPVNMPDEAYTPDIESEDDVLRIFAHKILRAVYKKCAHGSAELREMMIHAMFTEMAEKAIDIVSNQNGPFSESITETEAACISRKYEKCLACGRFRLDHRPVPMHSKDPNRYMDIVEGCPSGSTFFRGGEHLEKDLNEQQSRTS